MSKVEITILEDEDKSFCKTGDLFRWTSHSNNNESNICMLFETSPNSYMLVDLKNKRKCWTINLFEINSWISQGDLIRYPKGTQVTIFQD